MKVRPIVAKQAILDILNERLQAAEKYLAEDEASLEALTKTIYQPGKEDGLRQMIASSKQTIAELNGTIKLMVASEAPKVAVEFEL